MATQHALRFLTAVALAATAAAQTGWTHVQVSARKMEALGLPPVSTILERARS